MKRNIDKCGYLLDLDDDKDNVPFENVRKQLTDFTLGNAIIRTDSHVTRSTFLPSTIIGLSERSNLGSNISESFDRWIFKFSPEVLAFWISGFVRWIARKILIIEQAMRFPSRMEIDWKKSLQRWESPQKISEANRVRREKARNFLPLCR